MWLKSGDKNSRYFHAAATTRKKNNQIVKLQNSEGVWKEWENGLESMITDYYDELFSASQSQWEEIVCNVPRSITQAQNDSLVMPVTDAEVKNALFSMHPDKAPGPDGMTPAFFQRHWTIVGKDVVNLVRRYFAEGDMPHGLNDTNIVLIPKKKYPVNIGYLRPISLCNVLTKVITKVMANRMKGFLQGVVSENQSAFIPGRLISDNILISYEVMHHLKRKKRGKEGYMALKLDLSKAYDRVEWPYLQEMMLKMGFHERWVRLIMKSVNSVEYHITHGRRKLGPITPGRGIRQGDPISP